jgi:uncharacterized repeat protein (TIGR01451 family)
MRRLPIAKMLAATQGPVFAVLLAGHLAPVSAQATYTLRRIGSGTTPATDVNDANAVVGYWYNGASLGYVWADPESGTAVPLPLDAASISRFPSHNAINDIFGGRPRINGRGQIAGSGCADGSGCGGSQPQATLFDPPVPGGNAGTLRFLGFLGSGETSDAGGLNDAGLVVGASYSTGLSNRLPYVWRETAGMMSPIPGITLSGGATDVNDLGQVVGISGHSAFLSDGTNLTWIPGLFDTGTEECAALAVNALGQVAGRCNDNGAGGVFLWSAATGTVNLDAPAGYVQLVDMNDAGDIVATITAAGVNVPYLYRGGQWTDLNDLNPEQGVFWLEWATAINNNGWIVGAGTPAPGLDLQEGFVLIPPAAAAPDLAIVTTLVGELTQGQPGRYTLTVTNSGVETTTGAVTVSDTLPSVLSAERFSGPEGWTCTLVPLECSTSGALAPGLSAQLTLDVTVAPSAAGPVVNTATVSGGGDVTPGNNTASSTAAVLTAVLSLSSTAVNFGMVQVGGAQPATALEVTNTGTGAATIHAMQLGGANPGDFRMSSNCPLEPSPLAPGASCTVTTGLAATQVGPLSAIISLANSTASSPATIVLSAHSVDFGLSVFPDALTVKGGKQASVSVSVAPLGGNTLAATLSLTGCPVNATCTLSSQELALTGAGPSNSTLVIRGNGRTPKGTFTVTVVGTVAAVSRSAAVTVTVR